MGSFLVVLEQPPLGGLANVFQPHEQVLIQQLVAQRSIEPLAVGALVRLARLDVLDAMPAFFAHCVNASPRSPGPLSVRRIYGRPRCLRRRSKIRTSRSELI